jgi:hypothetical protein
LWFIYTQKITKIKIACPDIVDTTARATIQAQTQMVIGLNIPVPTGD